MSTPLLIKRSDFKGIVKIPANLTDDDLNQAILRAQDFDISRETGEAFYAYLFGFLNLDGTVKNDAPDEVKRIFSGYVYTVNQINITSPSIKEAIVYLAAARLIDSIDAHITPHGFRDKVNEFSEQVSGGRKSKAVNQMENMGLAMWHRIRNYMGHYKGSYTQYFGSGCECSAPRSGMRPRTRTISNL